MIGIGLDDEEDISVKALEAVKKCDKIYLENYTSVLQCTLEELEDFYGKKVISLEREDVEQKQPFLKEAKDRDVALLIIGDVFSATTHISIYNDAKEKGINVEVFNNASVINAVGITGLELYKFGKVTSIPFDNKNVKAAAEVLKMNSKNNLHTLFLLDLNPKEGKFLTINQAIEHLLKKSEKKLFNKDTFCVGCARLGTENFFIKYGPVSEVKMRDFAEPPYCLIVPGKLHFVEEEMLEMWRDI